MKHMNDVAQVSEYAARDGFLYARSFPGSAYGQFIKDLCQKVINAEVTLEEALHNIDTFIPYGAFNEIPQR